MTAIHEHDRSRRRDRSTAPQDFRAVRGRPEDEEWASDAWLALVLRGQVRSAAAEQALREVLDLVRASGEGPQDLYGPAGEWAQDRLDRWAAEGSDAIHDEPARWRDLPQVAAVTAVGVTLLAAPVCAVKGEWFIDWTLAWVLLPFLGPLVTLGAMAIREHVVTRHTVATGATAALAVIIGGSTGIAVLFAVTNPHPLGHAGIWWLLPLAAGYAALAWLLDRVTPHPPARGVARPLADDAWAGELARILRTRSDTTERQVHRLLDEAQDHAHHMGATLAEEFGSPAAYAAQVTPHPVVRARRSALYHTGTLALWAWLGWGLLFDTTQPWPRLALGWTALAGLGLAAAQACWTWAREERRHPHDPA